MMFSSAATCVCSEPCNCAFARCTSSSAFNPSIFADISDHASDARVRIISRSSNALFIASRIFASWAAALCSSPFSASRARSNASTAASASCALVRSLSSAATHRSSAFDANASLDVDIDAVLTVRTSCAGAALAPPPPSLLARSSLTFVCAESFTAAAFALAAAANFFILSMTGDSLAADDENDDDDDRRRTRARESMALSYSQSQSQVNIISASSIDRRSRIDPPSRAMRDVRAFFARRVDSGSIGAARDARQSGRRAQNLNSEKF